MRIFTIPLTTIIKCKKTQHFKLPNNIIRYSCSLWALFTLNCHTHICLSDHIFVISTIANCQRQIRCWLFNIFYEFFFLVRNASVANSLVEWKLWRKLSTCIQSINNISCCLLFKGWPLRQIFLLVIFVIIWNFYHTCVLTNHATCTCNIDRSLSLVTSKNEKLHSKLF